MATTRRSQLQPDDAVRARTLSTRSSTTGPAAVGGAALPEIPGRPGQRLRRFVGKWCGLYQLFRPSAAPSPDNEAPSSAQRSLIGLPILDVEEIEPYGSHSDEAEHEVLNPPAATTTSIAMPASPWAAAG